jgi:hypothetical protein
MPDNDKNIEQHLKKLEEWLGLSVASSDEIARLVEPSDQARWKSIHDLLYDAYGQVAADLKRRTAE